MEIDVKAMNHDSALEPPRQKKPNMVVRYTIATCVLLFWFLGYFGYQYYANYLYPLRHPRTIDAPGPGRGTRKGCEVNFSDIEPSEDLRWHPCWDGHLCARLTVPMDYHRPLSDSADNPKVHIALLMRPGLGHKESGNFSVSPLLINPGGPGGPGTYAAFGFGPHLQQVVGLDQDIIGFDPRGIANTAPLADCFTFSHHEVPTLEETKLGSYQRMSWMLSRAALSAIGVTDSALRKRDEGNRAFNKLCKQKDDFEGDNSILRHVDTPMVARDMISIIDAWDAWRDEKSKCNKRPAPKVEEENSVTSTKGKLVYWGFSYGTLLGATFAAMFPDRVGRLILDGVVDADHYVAPMWQNSIESDDAIVEKFHGYCHAAGSKCKLYREGDSEKDIKNRFFGIMDSLRNESIVTVEPYYHTPAVIDYTLVRSITFSLLYSPIVGFPILANLLHNIEQGDFFNVQTILSSSISRPEPVIMGDAQAAIMCSDKRYPFNESVPELEARFQNMTQLSSFADIWMTLMIQCNFWAVDPVDPPMRWDDHPVHKPKPINTSYPLLFISNTLDPVTPLSAGITMAQKFTNAGLVEQQSEGHCSLNAVSICTILAARRYIRDGLVPPPPDKNGARVKCEANEWPWKPFSENGRLVNEEWHVESLNGEESKRVVTEEEEQLLLAWKNMQEQAYEWSWYGKGDMAGHNMWRTTDLTV